jgi:hypothetical protein
MSDAEPDYANYKGMSWEEYLDEISEHLGQWRAEEEADRKNARMLAGRLRKAFTSAGKSYESAQAQTADAVLDALRRGEIGPEGRAVLIAATHALTEKAATRRLRGRADMLEAVLRAEERDLAPGEAKQAQNRHEILRSFAREGVKLIAREDHAAAVGLDVMAHRTATPGEMPGVDIPSLGKVLRSLYAHVTKDDPIAAKIIDGKTVYGICAMETWQDIKKLSYVIPPKNP